MITLLVLLTIIGVFALVFSAAWGIAKVVLTIAFLPLIVVGSILLGLFKVALPALIIAGVLLWAFSQDKKKQTA